MGAPYEHHSAYSPVFGTIACYRIWELGPCQLAGAGELTAPQSLGLMCRGILGGAAACGQQPEETPCQMPSLWALAQRLACAAASAAVP